MESLHHLFSFFFDFTLISGGLFFVVKLLQFKHNLSVKNDLQHVQSRISLLRINIKSKVKKRANAFRTYYAKLITQRHELDNNLTASVDITFETSRDFQQYFDLIKKIHSLVATLNKDPQTPIEKYLELDQKNEIAILRMTKKMKEVSHIYNEKVEAFNRLNLKNKLKLAEPLEFKALEEIEAILNLHPQPEAEPHSVEEDNEESKPEAS